jgi:hypothetical protein
METNLVFFKQASFFNVPLDYFQKIPSNSFPVVDKRLSDVKFQGILGSLPGFVSVIRKMGQPKVVIK